MNIESKIAAAKTLIAVNKALASLKGAELSEDVAKDIVSIQRKLSKITGTVLA